MFNNESYGTLDRYDIRQGTLNFFKYEKFLNITAVDKTKIPSDALSKIDYDLYDYLHFLLEDRLFYVGKSNFKLVGTFRIYQLRVELSSWDSTIPTTCDASWYKRLHSDECSQLLTDSNAASSYTAPTTTSLWALSNCKEYKYSMDSNNEVFNGKFGDYYGNNAYIVDIYYGMDAKTILNKLQTNNWIDDSTRALLFRWTVYNFLSK